MKRRRFLQSISYICACYTFLTKSLFADWPINLFESENYDHALNLLIDRKSPLNGSIELIAPTVAENGVKVPIEVKSNLDGVKSISVFVVNISSPTKGCDVIYRFQY